MSQKEATRAQVLGLLEEGGISQKEAAKRLALTARQVRRLSDRYRADGLSGLVSKKRGAPSNRRLDESTRLMAIEVIGEHYRDFGPTLAAEKLAERHQITLSVESTRQLMIAAGYWRPRKGSQIRAYQMRERRTRLGEMIQIDGSPHDWFEGRGERCTLLVFIDDATGCLMQLRFAPAETTLDYMRVLHDHILTHGVPVALYSDKHSIFRINTKEAPVDAETQFSRAARELGIECIHAHSPQAKGRVERANQTLQDRLVKEMRLAGLSDMASANAWLPGFIAGFNRRFGVAPADPRDAHLPYRGTRNDLARILSAQVTRTLSKSLSCQHKNQLMQIKVNGTGLGLRGAKIVLHEHFDGRKELLWRERNLAYTVLDSPLRQAPAADGKEVNTRVDKAVGQHNVGRKPPIDHPWRHKPFGKGLNNGPRVASQQKI